MIGKPNKSLKRKHFTLKPFGKAGSSVKLVPQFVDPVGPAPHSMAIQTIIIIIIMTTLIAAVTNSNSAKTLLGSKWMEKMTTR